MLLLNNMSYDPLTNFIFNIDNIIIYIILYIYQ